MELTTIKVYIPLGDYVTKYDFKGGEIIRWSDQVAAYKRIVKQALTSDQLLVVDIKNVESHSICNINDGRWSIEVEVVRLVDLHNIKYIKQQEIPFTDEKSI